jgi:hypothetical protein
MNFQSVSQNLGDDLIDNIAEAYRSELVSSVRATKFWNQCNEGVILVPLQKVVFEENQMHCRTSSLTISQYFL